MSVNGGDRNGLGLDYSGLQLPDAQTSLPSSTESLASAKAPSARAISARSQAAPEVASIELPCSGFTATAGLHPPPMRRTLHLSALSTLVLALPSALYSLMYLGMIGALVGAGSPSLDFLTLLFPVLWASIGGLLFYLPVEEVFLRVFMGFRRPTTSELRILQPIWARIADAAGVNPGSFVLSIENSAELNASAAAGHSVAVTIGALEQLEERHLEAVLAHELGHHLGGHPAAALWTYWIALPGRFINNLLRRIFSLINALIRFFSFRGWILTIALMVALIIGALLTAPWLLLILFIPFGLAATSRASELAADKAAVQLGYGSAMIEVLEIFDAKETQPLSEPQSRFGGLMASHPAPSTRIDKIRLLVPGARQQRSVSC